MSSKSYLRAGVTVNKMLKATNEKALFSRFRNVFNLTEDATRSSHGRSPISLFLVTSANVALCYKSVFDELQKTFSPAAKVEEGKGLDPA